MHVEIVVMGTNHDPSDFDTVARAFRVMVLERIRGADVVIRPHAHGLHGESFFSSRSGVFVILTVPAAMHEELETDALPMQREAQRLECLRETNVYVVVRSVGA